MTGLVLDGLRHWADSSPARPAIVFDGTDVVTYDSLDRWSDGAGALLSRAGLRRGDRVGIIGANSLEWVVAALGVLKLGGVVVPLNNRFGADEVAYLIDDSDPTFVLGDDDSAETVARATAGRPRKYIPLTDFGGLRGGEHERIARLDGVDADDVTQIVYTSGTTSRPKGVVFTHRSTFNIIADLAMNESVFRPGARVIYTLSMSGAPGLLWHFLHPLTRGMTVYYESRFEPQRTLDRLEAERIEVFCAVPLLFERVAAQPRFGDADLSALQLAVVGGAPVSETLIKLWLTKGVPLRQAYGMTELGGLPTFNAEDQALTRPRSIGRGSPNTRIGIVRPDGSACAADEPGEVVVAGPTITPGYWRNPSAYAEVMRNGWFHTGDLGVRDAQGWIQIVDRLKDIIITGGYNVAPAEIESVIADIDGVVDVCVIPVSDEKFGESPAAVVYCGRPVSADAILSHCRTRLAGYKIPRRVIVETEPLPRLISGKIARREIRNRYPQ